MTAEPSTERAVDDQPFAWPISEYGLGVNQTTYSVDTPFGVIYTTNQGLAEDIATLPVMKRELARLLDERKDATAPGRVPVRRSEDDRLESLCQLVEESVAVQRHNLSELREIRAALAADDRKDSFSFDNNASAGKIKVAGKRYASGIGDAESESELEFARGMAFIEEAQEVGWRATVEKLEAKRKASNAALAAEALKA